MGWTGGKRPKKANKKDSKKIEIAKKQIASKQKKS